MLSGLYLSLRARISICLQIPNENTESIFDEIPIENTWSIFTSIELNYWYFYKNTPGPGIRYFAGNTCRIVISIRGEIPFLARCV